MVGRVVRIHIAFIRCTVDASVDWLCFSWYRKFRFKRVILKIYIGEPTCSPTTRLCVQIKCALGTLTLWRHHLMIIAHRLLNRLRCTHRPAALDDHTWLLGILGLASVAAAALLTDHIANAITYLQLAYMRYLLLLVLSIVLCAFLIMLSLPLLLKSKAAVITVSSSVL